MTVAKRTPTWIRAIIVIGLLYLFLAGVGLLEAGVKLNGEGLMSSLVENASNPLVALFVGILATVLVQSSSATTATIVAFVAAGTLPVDVAVPMIMGANIGTTVTNTLVSLGHVRRSDEFRRAFTAATMHDFFNVMAVAIFLPLEIATGLLETSAGRLAGFFFGDGDSGGAFKSPIKSAVKWFGTQVRDALELLFSSDAVVGGLMVLIGIFLVLLSLTFITKNMRLLVASRIERSLNSALEKAGWIGIFVGLVVTMSVQSSSITTSILIPLVASGILAVRSAYPITLGANIGTTVTALIAALGAGSVAGLQIAFVHTLFNVFAILLIYPWKGTRFLPVSAAEYLAGLAIKNKSIVFAYVGGGFILLPIVGILVLS
jgi:solute carrier family 34 (sodium-dependent phosphate cotransporter)